MSTSHIDYKSRRELQEQRAMGWREKEKALLASTIKFIPESIAWRLIEARDRLREARKRLLSISKIRVEHGKLVFANAQDLYNARLELAAAEAELRSVERE